MKTQYYFNYKNSDAVVYRSKAGEVKFWSNSRGAWEKSFCNQTDLEYRTFRPISRDEAREKAPNAFK